MDNSGDSNPGQALDNGSNPQWEHANEGPAGRASSMNSLVCLIYVSARRPPWSGFKYPVAHGDTPFTLFCREKLSFLLLEPDFTLNETCPQQ
jgi:hypothetical protein